MQIVPILLHMSMNCGYISTEGKRVFGLAHLALCTCSLFSFTDQQLRFVDENKAFDFCREAQEYFKKIGARTQVLAASLTSVDEIMQLSGLQHITISPPLLKGLAEQDAAAWHGPVGTLFTKELASSSREVDYSPIVKLESAWKLAFTRSGFGTSHGKIVQAINYFADFQEKLEDLARNSGMY